MTDISMELAKEAPKSGFAGAEYNVVASAVVLEGINLFSSHFKIDPNCLLNQGQWKLSYGRKVLSCHFSEEENSVAAIFQYHVTAKFGRKQALHCVADYGVFYHTPELLQLIPIFVPFFRNWSARQELECLHCLRSHQQHTFHPRM
jgi:hypothetical protein